MLIDISKVIDIYLQVYYAAAGVWDFAVRVRPVETAPVAAVPVAIVLSPPEILSHVLANKGNCLFEKCIVV